MIYLLFLCYYDQNLSIYITCDNLTDYLSTYITCDNLMDYQILSIYIRIVIKLIK